MYFTGSERSLLRAIPNLKVAATSLDDGNGRGRGFQSPLPYACVQRYRVPHFLSQSRQPIPARLLRRLSLCVSPVGHYDFRHGPSGVVEIQQQYVRAPQVVITRGSKIFGAGVVVPNPRDSASERPLGVGDAHVPVDRLEAGSIEYLRARGRGPGRAKKHGSGNHEVTHPLSPRTARRVLLFHEYPFRLEQRECDEPDDRRRGHEQGIADLPAEQNDEARERHQHSEPVADGDLPEQDAGNEDGADGGGVCAFDEALHIWIRPVAHKDRRDDQDQEKRRQEDTDRRGDRTPETVEKGAGESRGDEVPDERCCDDNGAGADHPHGNRDEEIVLVQPVHLLHESFLEERDDDEATAERERAGLQEEREELTEQRAERARRRG